MSAPGGRAVPAAGAGTRATAFAVGGVEYLVAGRVPRSLPAPRPLPPRLEHRGEQYPVIDLPALCGSREETECGPLVLLIEQEPGGRDGGGALRRALVVERLLGSEVVDPEAVQPVPAAYPESERRRWRGLVPRPDGRLAVVLRLEGLPPAGAGAAAEGEG